jgi:CRISPR-associated endonuclease/helicase Cas3
MMLHGGDRWRKAAASEPLAKSGMDPADRAAFRRAARLSGYPSGMRHEAMSARFVAVLLRQAHHQAVAGPAACDGTKLSNAVPASEFEGHAVDGELIVHLVSTHHGWGRPLLPPIVDPAPVNIAVTANGLDHGILSSADTVDWAGPSRFAQLSEKYGRWGLALLESIVRLADIWCSARSEECHDHDS